MTQDVQTIKKDRLRYTKDSFSSTMAILELYLIACSSSAFISPTWVITTTPG